MDEKALEAAAKAVGHNHSSSCAVYPYNKKAGPCDCRALDTIRAAITAYLHQAGGEYEELLKDLRAWASAPGAQDLFCPQSEAECAGTFSEAADAIETLVAKNRWLIEMKEMAENRCREWHGRAETAEAEVERLLSNLDFAAEKEHKEYLRAEAAGAEVERLRAALDGMLWEGKDG